MDSSSSGKITFNCLTSALQTVIAVGLGVWLLDIWFFFLTIFALRIRRNDVFNTFINVAYFVLLFVATVFYPLDHMPAWLRTAALLNPVTWHTDVLRYLTIGIGQPERIVIEMICFAGFLVISFWVAVKTLRRAV